VEQEIFKASAKEGLVKVLGIKLGCNLEDLHIYVNGVDVTKSFVLEEVRIVADSSSGGPLVVFTSAEKKAE
jgi:hypothetical protein